MLGVGDALRNEKDNERCRHKAERHDDVYGNGQVCPALKVLLRQTQQEQAEGSLAAAKHTYSYLSRFSTLSGNDSSSIK